jgi:2-oxoglutarate dehydrogenase N-terminus
LEVGVSNQQSPIFRKKAMSAVSSKTPLAAADPSAPSATSSSAGVGRAGEPTEPGATPANADFGTNEWLVDELYQQYLDDPASVDRAWW